MGKNPKKPPTPGRKAVERPAESDEVKPSDVRRTISERKLRELLSDNRTAQADIDEISGTMGSAVKQAVEKHHLHRRAFNIVKSLDRMEPEKLAECLDYVDDYLEKSGLRDRAAKVTRLQFGDASADDGDDAGPAAENVRPFPKPSGIAAE